MELPAQEQFPRFSAKARCSKCGGQKVETQYCGPGQRLMIRCTKRSEHIHRRCSRCKYIWDEAPLDGRGGE